MHFIKTVSILVLVLAIAALINACTTDESDSVREEIEELRSVVDEIRSELKEVKQILQSREPAKVARPEPVLQMTFKLDSFPVKGDVNAPITIIEFSDYQCPYCSRFKLSTYPEIERAYIDTGKARYAVLDLPLETIHPLAFKAAEAAHCAGEQGQYWEMHERLYANQRALQPWQSHVEALGLNGSDFDECLDTGRTVPIVRKGKAEAAKAGATGTPSFVIGMTDPADPNVVKGFRIIRGAQSFAAFKAVLESAAASLVDAS